MKICQLKLKLFLPAFVLSVFGFLLFSINTVKAAQGEYFSGSGTITSGNDQILICSFNSLGSTPATWNSVALTQFPNVLSVAGSYIKLYYLVNPSVGTYSIQGGNSYSTPQCVVLENVDQTNPISSSRTINSNPDTFNLTQTSGNNTALMWWVNFRYNDTDFVSSDPAWDILFQYPNDYNRQGLLSATTNGTQSVVFNSPGWNYHTGYFIELTNSGPAPYCGDGICNNGETDLTCIDCLTIYDMTTLQDTYLWFDNAIQYCPIDTSCKISYHFDTSIFNYSDYGKLYYYPTSTSSPQFVENISPLANNWELGEMDSGSFIASSTSTSTQFSYFQMVPCQNSGDCFGTSTIAIWYSAKPDYAAIVSDLWPATSSTSTEDMIDDFNMTAYHLTCSDEQWSGDWWTKLGCYFRFGEIVLQKKSVDILNRSMGKTWSKLKNIFPFNFASLINTSWKNSSASSTPAELEFLDMLDDEGNISFDFSAMTGTTTKLKFWGADTFNNTNGEFTKVRTISKYLFYGLLILYIYLKGKSVYKEFIGNKEE